MRASMLLPIIAAAMLAFGCGSEERYAEEHRFVASPEAEGLEGFLVFHPGGSFTASYAFEGDSLEARGSYRLRCDGMDDDYTIMADCDGDGRQERRYEVLDGRRLLLTVETDARVEFLLDDPE